MDLLDTEPLSGSGSPIQISCIEHNLGTTKVGRKILWRNEEDARVNRSGVQADSRNFSRSPRGGTVRHRQDEAKFVNMQGNVTKQKTYNQDSQVMLIQL